MPAVAVQPPWPTPERDQNGHFIGPLSVIQDVERFINDKDPDQFSQLSGADSLAILKKVLSVQVSSDLDRLLLRETMLEKLHARAWKVWGLDKPTASTVSVVAMSSAGPKRLSGRIIDAQVVDSQAQASDSQSEGCDGDGI